MLSRANKAGIGCLLGILLGPIGLIITWSLRRDWEADEAAAAAKKKDNAKRRAAQDKEYADRAAEGDTVKLTEQGTREFLEKGRVLGRTAKYNMRAMDRIRIDGRRDLQEHARHVGRVTALPLLPRNPRDNRVTQNEGERPKLCCVTSNHAART